MKPKTTPIHSTDSSLAGFPLLAAFVGIWDQCRCAFVQDRVHQTGLTLAFGLISALGRRTISRGICARALQHLDWSRYYRFFSKDIWYPVVLTHQLLAHLDRYLQPDSPLVIGLDDTSIDKTGKKIPATGYFYNPKSPPFARSYKWALRFISISALINPHGPLAAARGILIKFKLAPTLPKPKKKDPPQCHRQHKLLAHNWSITTQAIEQIHLIRAQMHAIASHAKRLLVVVADASYTNQTFLRNIPTGCVYIGRTRKDLALFAPARSKIGSKGRKKQYGEQLPTPDAIRQSNDYPWLRCNVFAAQRWHNLRYKLVKSVLWKSAGYKRPVTLIIIAPLHYRLTNNSKFLYREPAYLLVSDPSYSPVAAIQHYFHRWQIEVNHRDCKEDLGVGDAQVRHPHSVCRQFSFAAIVSSLLTCASWDAYGYSRTTNYAPRAKWRNDLRSRPSTLDLLCQFRQELWLYESGGQLVEFCGPSRLAPNHPKYVASAQDWLASTVPRGLPITAWSAILHADT